MVHESPRTSCLRALRLLLLLGDGAVVLGLILGQGRVRLGERGRSTPQGQLQQELPGRHQVAVALGVREGVARPAGADTPGLVGRWGSWQRLLPHLMSHLQGGERDTPLMLTSYSLIGDGLMLLLLRQDGFTACVIVCSLTLSLMVGRS